MKWLHKNRPLTGQTDTYREFWYTREFWYATLATGRSFGANLVPRDDDVASQSRARDGNQFGAVSNRQFQKI